MSNCLVDPQLKHTQCCCRRPSRRTPTRLGLNHTWCLRKTEISFIFGACALRLGERSEPRALLLSTLWHGLPRARASAHLRTHAHAPKDSRNLTNPHRFVGGFSSFELDLFFGTIRSSPCASPSRLPSSTSAADATKVSDSSGFIHAEHPLCPPSHVLMFSRWVQHPQEHWWCQPEVLIYLIYKYT